MKYDHSGSVDCVKECDGLVLVKRTIKYYIIHSNNDVSFTGGGCISFMI